MRFIKIQFKNTLISVDEATSEEIAMLILHLHANPLEPSGEDNHPEVATLIRCLFTEDGKLNQVKRLKSDLGIGLKNAKRSVEMALAIYQNARRPMNANQFYQLLTQTGEGREVLNMITNYRE